MSSSEARARRYRARVAPRSGARGAGSRIRWDKVGRVVLVLVLFAVLASYVKPALNVFGVWREAGQAEQRLAVLERQHERLQTERKLLDTGAAQLREARDAGLVAAGERAAKVEGLKGLE